MSNTRPSTPEELVIIEEMGARMFTELRTHSPTLASGVITYLIAAYCKNAGQKPEFFVETSERLMEDGWPTEH